MSESSNAATLTQESCETQMDWNGTDHSAILIDLQNKTEEIRKLKLQLSEKNELISFLTLDQSAYVDEGINRYRASQSTLPLHYAAKIGDLEGARILLENGADVRRVDNRGNLPLHYAVSRHSSHNRALIRLLVERDLTTINRCNYLKETPFFDALTYVQDVSLISYLLEKGAQTVNGFREDWPNKITAFHHAVSHDRYNLLPLLLESVSTSHIEKFCSIDIKNNIQLATREFHPAKEIVSLTCSAIDLGSNCLAVLMSRDLPEAVLQAPSLLRDEGIPNFSVYSPLAYLFSRFYVPRDEKFDQCLDMLLKHNITTMCKFRRETQINWPTFDIRYIHPLKKIFHPSVSLPEQLHYFNLLNANGVTTDYCLQCYHDNTISVVDFPDFLDEDEPHNRYYGFVIDVADRGEIETLKLLISTSDILEPDVIMCCLLGIGLSRSHTKDSPMVEYLMSLKPIFYDDDLHYTLLSYFEPSEIFSKVTLKGLCRTAIRLHLREPTLQANLLNFRRKILELPLPGLLKDYLLFKI